MLRHRLTVCGALVLTSVIAPAGQAFAHPPTTEPTPTRTQATATATTYVVKDGDYLFGIAAKLKVRLASLLQANNLTLNSAIHPGQVLVVPAASTTTTAGAPSSNNAATPTVQAVIDYAKAQVGKPYKFAAAGPDAFDCSGLTSAAYRQIGVKLPQYSVLQATAGRAVDLSVEPIRPGDLIFLTDSTTGLIGHVGIAVSDTEWVHALRSGDYVRRTKLPAASKITAVRRIV